MVMKAHAKPNVEKYLDVCYLQSVVTTQREKPALYYMTLLAHAGVNRQKGMVKYLLESGASKLVPKNHHCLDKLGCTM